MENVNLLLVKHGQKELGFLVEHLSKNGYALEKAQTRKDALKILEDKNIHIIILNAPSVSSDVVSICKEIRKRSYQKPLQILFLTSVRDPKTYEQMLDIGADDFLRKPLDDQELHARVKAAVIRLKKQAGNI